MQKEEPTITKDSKLTSSTWSSDDLKIDNILMSREYLGGVLGSRKDLYILFLNHI